MHKLLVVVCLKPERFISFRKKGALLRNLPITSIHLQQISATHLVYIFVKNIE
ncbi:hypothetical protein Hanom_Chr03g00277981 [Helianthus anomalus]